MLSKPGLKKARENIRTHGVLRIFGGIACLILGCYIVFSIISTNKQISDSKQKYEDLVVQTETVLEQNASISRYLEDGADLDGYIEDIAR
ncbi:MAG: hypothetical protein ACI4KA_00630, partial [Oscillospiraceae bacterium]